MQPQRSIFDLQQAEDLFFADLDRAIVWLTSLGGRVAGTRYLAYRRALAHARRPGAMPHRSAKQLADVALADLYHAVMEVRELIQVHRVLGGKHDGFVQRRLQLWLKGNYRYSDDKFTDAKGRTYGHELTVASRFVCGSLELDSNYDGDLAFNTKQGPIFIECKRPQLERAILGNYSEAASRLRDDYVRAADPRSRGLVALDLTRVANPSGSLMLVSDFRQAAEWCSACLRHFLKKYEAAWRKDRKDNRTLGVYLRLGLMVGKTTGSPEMSYFHWDRIAKWPALSPSDEMCIADLQQALSLAGRRTVLSGILTGRGGPPGFIEQYVRPQIR